MKWRLLFVTTDKKELPERIMDLLKEAAEKEPNVYVNPIFLDLVVSALCDHCNLRDKGVDKYFNNMWNIK